MKDNRHKGVKWVTWLYIYIFTSWILFTQFFLQKNIALGWPGDTGEPEVNTLNEWVIPEFGEFECDYVTSCRAESLTGTVETIDLRWGYHPKKGSKPLSDALWEAPVLGDWHILSVLHRFTHKNSICKTCLWLHVFSDRIYWPNQEEPSWTYASLALVGPVSPVGKLLWKRGSLPCRFQTTFKCRMLQHTVDLSWFFFRIIGFHRWILRLGPLLSPARQSLMMVMYDSPCSPQNRLKVLKSISHQFFLSHLPLGKSVGKKHGKTHSMNGVTYVFLVDWHFGP